MKLKILSFTLLVLLILSGCGKDKEIKGSYETVKPQRGDIVKKVLATGTLSPYRRIEIQSTEQGRVESIKVDEGSRVKQGQILALISTINRISLLDTAKANLYQAQKTGDSELIKQAENDLAIAQKAYNPVPIISPVSGEVIKRSINVGENVNSSQSLFVISDRLVLHVLVDESDIGSISLNQKTEFNLETFTEEKHIARVKKISREGEEVNNVMQYEVICFPETTLKKWISGMTVNAEFILEEKKNILLLPVDAVKTLTLTEMMKLRGGKQQADQDKKFEKIKDRTLSFVVVQSNNKKILQPVKTGLSDYKNIEIVKGVNEKDQIIILTQNEFMDFLQGKGKTKKTDASRRNDRSGRNRRGPGMGGMLR